MKDKKMKLNAKQLSELLTHINKMDGYRLTIKMLSEESANESKKMWGIIKKIYPV